MCKKNKKIVEFIHIPKCGGWTIYNYFERQFGKEEIIDITYVNDLAERPFERKSLIIGHRWRNVFDKIKERQGYEGVRFVIVREPVERLWSYYRYLARAKHLNTSTWLPRASFKEFCECVAEKTLYLKENNANRFAGHEASQATYVTGLESPTKGQILTSIQSSFDFVVPIASLDKLLHHISDLFGLPRLPIVKYNADNDQIEYTLQNEIFEDDRLFVQQNFENDCFLYQAVCNLHQLQ